MSDPSPAAHPSPELPRPSRTTGPPGPGGGPRQVLVVGAGPVGLVAACELARHGVVPRVVEALAEPTVQSRAVGVQPRSQEMFAALGVLDRILASSLPQHHIELDAPAGDGFRRLAQIDLTDLPTRHPDILNLPQTATEAVLRERAGELGVVVERGVTLTGLTQDAEGVDVVLRSAQGDEHARVDWVVGADGGHSAVRKLAGVALEGSFHGVHFAMGDVVVESGFPRDVTRLFVSPGGLNVMMCMPHGRTRLMFQIPEPGPDAPSAPTFEEFVALAHDRIGPTVTLSEPSWMTYYAVHHGQVPRYRAGRVLLAGDAAHIHSPAAAQGMNTGMQDAANLAWKLALVARGLAGDDLVDSYHAERHPVGAAVVRKATAMTGAMALTGARARIRNTGMRVVGHLDGLARHLAENIAQLTVSYTASPIVRRDGHHPHGALRPGEHAEDLAELTDGSGAPTRVEDLLRRAPGHLLLLGDGSDPDRWRAVLGELGTVVPVVGHRDDASPEALVDAAGELRARYGIGDGGFALVRPDGYLGLVSSTADPEVLQDYLRDVLTGAGRTAVRG